MPEPTVFTSTTTRFGLPVLFAGQAQKEFSVNEANGLIDALMHASISGVAANPPSTPSEGEAWLADSASTGDWSGRDHHICAFFGGTWHYIAPQNGMTVFDEGLGIRRHYDGGWHFASEPSSPSGGSTVDAEVRIALLELVEALRKVGIFSRY